MRGISCRVFARYSMLDNCKIYEVQQTQDTPCSTLSRPCSTAAKYSIFAICKGSVPFQKFSVSKFARYSLASKKISQVQYFKRLNSFKILSVLNTYLSTVLPTV
jgi:hypothetical protein